MKDDYLSIKHVENGFVLELNPYASTPKRKGHYVARTERELHALLREMFPVEEVACPDHAMQKSNQ